MSKQFSKSSDTAGAGIIIAVYSDLQLKVMGTQLNIYRTTGPMYHLLFFID